MSLKQHTSRLARLCALPMIAVLTACGGGDGGDDGGGSSRTFISWNNNTNGTIIKDANNENYSFYSDTRCLYSHISGREISNYCVGANGLANFAGTDIRVRIARSTSGNCIAVLSAPDGRAVDIYAESGTLNFRITSSTWSFC